MVRGVGELTPQRSAARAALLLLAAFAVAAAMPQGGGETVAPPRVPLPGSDGCLRCHEGIEDMHPGAKLSCIDCHGGDATARDKLEAHVPRQQQDSGDERVAALDDDLAWRRFVNPMDLRVAEKTCGTCHESEVKRVHTSLHATTAGHLSDGYYEMGLDREKGSEYGVFPVPARKAEPGDIDQLLQIPAHREAGGRDALSSHYSDLARKECMQCHLWSDGRAVRGRVGFDGDYRGEGCAACHVPYARDGLSESADKSANRNEPGHAREHAMTRAPTTDACVTCHYGDASIGLNFRGLSQLPPGAPGGPEIEGTTDALLNRAFYLDDARLVPPDVHHEKGMHCIDCHTQNDVMGDGKLYGAMEHAVEISCTDCHGTFTQVATLRTQRGTPLTHLERVGDEVILTSKVDGSRHDVPQAVHVLDPKRPEFNEKAAQAMTGAHAKLECYTCHASWNPNFIGFHFDRNESLTQLDLISGLRTPGRVTTQEKVFATWKSFYAGLNEAGRFAPYLTGFATMGTVRDETGAVLVDQALPETAAGLSGMTMIHHQMHTTRKTARSCVECHRTSTTWGLGSVNFRLARQLAFVADRRGLEVVALNRQQLSASTPISKLVLPDIVDLELDCDPLQGFARRVFAAEGQRGIHVIDASDPRALTRTQFVATIEPQCLTLAGNHLYVADGAGGLRIFDVSKQRIAQASMLPMFDARGVHVQWPYAYVADGPGGLVIVDIRDARKPVIVGGAKTNLIETREDSASFVSVLFQYSRPTVVGEQPSDRRSPARNLCAVLDENAGLVLFDVTEPSAPLRLYPSSARGTRADRPNVTWRGMLLASHVDIAEPQGGTRTREGDFVYALQELALANGTRNSQLVVFDVTDFKRVRPVANVDAGQATEMLCAASLYNPPFLQSVVFAPGSDGVFANDVTISAEPKQLGALGFLREAYVVAVEEFPLDKQLDEAGRRLKDTSHVGSRWLTLSEIERLLLVPLPNESEAGEVPGMTARLHFDTLDRDGSGIVDGAELEHVDAALDVDGDGRVLLAELAIDARLSQPSQTATPARGPQVFLETRVDPDGDLSRLLDGISPFAFDGNQDRKLDAAELARSFFSALDLDRDKSLSVDELSRHPGELRELRFGGPRATQLLATVDDNKDGKLQARELEVAALDFEALDPDRDGFVHLGQPRNPYWEIRGILGAQAEWPTRRRDYVALPLDATLERVLQVFDADANGELTARELRKRPDLLTDLDRDGSSLVSSAEINARIDALAARGVDAAPDGFVERWDLDGDGEVDARELSEVARIVVERR